ncbi:MAG TPA: ABC transporter substrate-binding protein [Solirubrobacterales bacterium]|nr:ABC transporter substrate-binding protein [Solirubrobacterales bacterium]
MKVTLDQPLDAANVAVEMGVDRGYFTDVGLNIWQASPELPRRPVTYVTVGAAEFGLTQQPQVALAKKKGAPLDVMGSLIPEPTAAMIWLSKSKIKGIADLDGKTIAVPGIPYQERLLEKVLAKAGLKLEDVEVKRVAYDLVPVLLEGKADAIFGGTWNIEGIALRERGAKPVIRRVQELGAPSYDELVVITRSDRAAKEPRTIRNFVSALGRAVAAVKSDPEAAVQLIEESDPTLSHREIEAQVRATIPLLSTPGEEP